MSNSTPALELLSVFDAAAFLTISVPTLRRLQTSRRIPFYKVGGRIRFSTVDLMAYLEKHRTGEIDS